MTPRTPPGNVGIIGTGGISHFHFEGYRQAGANIVAAADADPTVLAERRRQFEVPRGYLDYRELLADPAVGAVSICLPNALHHPATLAAVRAGKHVLCEKPIAPTVALADEMIAAAREAGVVLQINHQLRADGAVARAKSMIEAGRLGRLTYLRFRQAHDWAGLPSVRDSFGRKANAGGGTLLDNGCHMMDLARFLGGPVREVYARTATLKFAVEVEDTSVVTLAFASGALGSVENAWTATGWEEGFWVYGTEGALEYTNRLGRPILRHAFRDSPGTTWAGTDVAVYEFGGQGAHHRCIRAFLEAVAGERDPICRGEDGREALRLVLEAYESARLNQPVEVAAVSPA